MLGYMRALISRKNDDRSNLYFEMLGYAMHRTDDACHCTISRSAVVVRGSTRFVDDGERQVMGVVVYCRAVEGKNVLQRIEFEWDVLHESGVLEYHCVPGFYMDGWDKRDEFDTAGFDAFGNGEDKVPWVGYRLCRRLYRAWLVVVNE